jgi:hypothetical protein
MHISVNSSGPNSDQSIFLLVLGGAGPHHPALQISNHANFCYGFFLQCSRNPYAIQELMQNASAAVIGTVNTPWLELPLSLTVLSVEKTV